MVKGSPVYVFTWEEWDAEEGEWITQCVVYRNESDAMECGRELCAEPGTRNVLYFVKRIVE